MQIGRKTRSMQVAFELLQFSGLSGAYQAARTTARAVVCHAAKRPLMWHAASCCLIPFLGRELVQDKRSPLWSSQSKSTWLSLPTRRCHRTVEDELTTVMGLEATRLEFHL